jgi:dienelactone hydrolase
MIFVLSGTLTAAEEIYSPALPPGGKGLTFPASPQAFGFAKASRMFKPEGAGPFPGLVILPTCGGHAKQHAFDPWARAALDRGYAVMVVDPLTPRGVNNNCTPPVKVTTTRFREDAIDAAEHLGKQTFVDGGRIGLLGLSLGAMAGLGAADEKYAGRGSKPAFRAIVSVYPICFVANIRIPGRGGPVDVRFIPDKTVVPLLVQMGDLDTEAPPKECIPRLEQLKGKGSAVEFVVHKNATHGWDQEGTFRKKGLAGQDVVYRYNPEVTTESVKQAFDFLDRHVKGK